VPGGLADMRRPLLSAAAEPLPEPLPEGLDDGIEEAELGEAQAEAQTEEPATGDEDDEIAEISRIAVTEQIAAVNPRES
jgi:hypothetical protein